MPSDRVYRYFQSEGDAEKFLRGEIILRSSYFYEMLEYAGDTYTGDALERTRTGFSADNGASTWKSFVPKFLFCSSNSKSSKDKVCWVEIDSSKDFYAAVKEKLFKEFSGKSLMIGTLSCVNVTYLDPEEIHKLNTEKNEAAEEGIKLPIEIKRKQYAYQDEWRIVFEAASKNGGYVGQRIKIHRKSLLGLFLRKEKANTERSISVNYREILSGFREIRLDLGSLKQIARIC